jgi:hypothetical protein
MRPCFFSDEIPRFFLHVVRPLVAGLTGGLRARVHRSAGEERPDGEATNARMRGPAAFPQRLGGPASRWRRRVAGTIPGVQAFVELLAKFAHRRMPGMNRGVVTAMTGSDGAERKHERRSS